MNKKAWIYLHRNKKNGKCYVGKTVQNIKRRWRNTGTNYSAYENCVVFHKALKLDTWDGFESVVLEETTAELASSREEFYINQYNSLVPNGYNLISFDNGLHTYSDEIREKISSSKKQYHINNPGKAIAPNKTPIVQINGIESKSCSTCKLIKPLSDFGINKRKGKGTGINWSCKPCCNERNKAHRIKNAKPKQPVDYSLRRDAMSAGAKKAYENNPELKKQISQARSKAVVAIHVETGERLEFESALKAGESGFRNAYVSRYIKSGKVFKGYRWYFKKDYNSSIA